MTAPREIDRPQRPEFSTQAAWRRLHAFLDEVEPRTAFAAIFVCGLFLYGLANSLKGFRHALQEGPGVGLLVGAALSLVGGILALALLYLTAHLVLRLFRSNDSPSAPPRDARQRLRELSGPEIRYPLK
jgi:hypothetical protein